MSVTTLYQKKRTGKMWQWSIEAVGNRIITAYGYTGGAMQTTSEVAPPMNVGRSNEVSAEKQAVLMMGRKIKSKTDNGYCLSIEEADEQDLGEELSLTNLPKSFCPAKPITSISEKLLRAMWEAGILAIHRKFDGRCHFGVSHDNGISILSRGKLEENAPNVPHIVKELSKVPRGTILNGEICMDPNLGDNMDHVSSVMSTDDIAEALEKQREGGTMHYVVFDVLFWEGEDVTDYPYAQRIRLFEKWAKRRLPKKGFVHTPINLATIYTFDDLFRKEDNIAIKSKFEGYVIWNTEESTEIRFDGKEARRNCYKFKPVHSEDIIAKEPYTGKGKNSNRLGGIHAYQWYDGELIFVGKIGGGFDDAEREQFWADRETMFPCVFEVETPERLKSMKLRFPEFMRLRPDKDIKECHVQLLPRNAAS